MLQIEMGMLHLPCYNCYSMLHCCYNVALLQIVTNLACLHVVTVSYNANTLVTSCNMPFVMCPPCYMQFTWSLHGVTASLQSVTTLYKQVLQLVYIVLHRVT